MSDFVLPNFAARAAAQAGLVGREVSEKESGGGEERVRTQDRTPKRRLSGQGWFDRQHCSNLRSEPQTENSLPIHGSTCSNPLHLLLGKMHPMLATIIVIITEDEEIG